MKNSTKIWQEKFNEMSEIEEFWGLPYDRLVDKAVKQFIYDLILQTREETIRELKEKESIKLVHEKAFNCPTLSIQCNHDFKFSHTEEENKIGSVGTTTGTMPPRLFDVVVCSKCGEIRKSLKYLTN